MEPNLWIYSKVEQEKTADSLIFFGAEVFKRAKSIKEINILQTTLKEIESHKIHPKDSNLSEFIFEYLVDCIRFMVFFENYMKAELILRDYCVHKINRKYPGFKSLAKSQETRPIKLIEINEIKEFVIDIEHKTIGHPAIKETTIGINGLICNEQYYSHYKFDSAMREIIDKLRIYRNRLHLNLSIELLLSSSFISDLNTINSFVNEIIKTRIKTNDL